MNERDPYLLLLNRRLLAAAGGWDEQIRAPHLRFLRSRRRSDGGFAGRGETSDLYYTAFALRALALLDGLDEATRAAVSCYLADRSAKNIIELVSHLFCRRMIGQEVDDADRAALGVVAALRNDDGGYARAPGGASGTYHTFLAALCYDLAGQTPPQPQMMAAFIQSRRRSDGGAAELAQMPYSSINPTAAAAAILLAAGEADGESLDRIAEFLLPLQRDDGGFPAGPRVKRGDLLSTFTTLLTLHDLGAADRADLAAAARFAQSCRGDNGGYRGAPDDSAADVEYTFYGLGVAALTASAP